MSGIDYEFEKNLLNYTDKLIKARLESLAFNYCIQGSISSVNSDGTYDIKINDVVFKNVSSTSEHSYVINDVVWVLYINGNSSYKRILCKY